MKDFILEYFHLLNKKMFLFQKNQDDDLRKDMIITREENKVTIVESIKHSNCLSDNHKLSTSSFGTRINNTIKVLLSNSWKL